MRVGTVVMIRSQSSGGVSNGVENRVESESQSKYKVNVK